MQKLFTILLLFLIVHVHPNLFAQGSDCCDREAILYCEYQHAFIGNIAEKKIEKEFSASVIEKFKEVFTRDCFQLMLPMPLDAANEPQNEYLIEVKHRQITNYSDWPNPKLVAELFCEVQGFRESVHFWEVEEEGVNLTVEETSWPSLLDKLVNKIKNGPEITDIIEKFEKRPVKLEVGCDKEEFDPGEVISVYLLGFEDKYGQTSREFNRIVVQVSTGEIINETPCDLGPDYYAFNIDRNLEELKYKVPENCKNPSVKFTIYNSCDILSESFLFLHKTQTKDRLTEKDFGINCYDAKIIVTKNYKKVLQTSHENSENGEVHKHNLNESIEATATLYLEQTETQDMPIFNQTWEYYKPLSVNLTAFNYNSKEKKHSSSPNYDTNIDYSRNANKHEIEGKEHVTQMPWMLVIDNESGKAVKILPAGYAIAYEINEMEKINTVIYSDDGTQRESKTNNKTSSKSFKLGPTGEKIPDPTIKKSDNLVQDYLKRQGVELPAGVTIPKISNDETVKKIQPDILIRSGDGKYSFGGDGRRTIRQELEDGFQEENFSYKWQMTIKKKK